jgi:hypothetical protein
VSVEDGSEELWVGVKCQSNLEIAGSPRNAFRCSLTRSVSEVEHWLAEGPHRVTEVNQTPNAATPQRGSETVGAKLHGQKGNSPDPPLRSPNPAKCERKWEHADSQDVGLEAATIERVRNSLLAECGPAPIM